MARTFEVAQKSPRSEEKDYRRYSFWLQTAGEDLAPRAALDGAQRADVAILGAGFTGLWTAYYLLKNAPSLRVVVLEGEVAGFGASGRNGAWCGSGFPVTPAELAQRFGREAARGLIIEMQSTVDEVGRVAEVEGIDAQYFRGGMLRVARGPGQLPAVRAAHEAYSALGLGDDYQVLDAEETDRRVRIKGTKGALYNPHCASVHPGRLVRGLARTVERLGGTIFELSPVVGYETGGSPRLATARGEVRAGAIVLAGEAYLTRFRKLRRKMLPIYSLIVLTEPLSEAQWE